ncbi:SMP-30/gluconolactonase/LRE family protein [Mariniphaga sediminis]|uniref:SMP-30/gluconolactonase/LRE family protein n=1 Tax=Mariniphaga sediminis TaxID=1628158 RepID=UPI003565A5BD
MDYKCIISELKFPEGPVFDPDGNLWFVEIQRGTLSCWDGKELMRYDVAGTPNGAMIDREGNIWFCDSGRGEIRTFNPRNQKFETICNQTTDGKRLKRPNDLIFDREGNLLFSDHADGREEPVATLCVLPQNKKEAKIISTGKFFTNGLAFMADGKTLIFAETYRQQLWIAEWDAGNRELKNEHFFAKAGNGPWGPDGMALDEEENLYVAVFNESKINIYNKKGELSGHLDCPGSRPTSCAFDPSGKLGLVVTEAENGQVISYPAFNRGLPIYYR